VQGFFFGQARPAADVLRLLSDIAGKRQAVA
jgi:hypothetical protein